jgi:pyrimidine operon attenuation protein/uracil phosphoribosyltransferase
MSELRIKREILGGPAIERILSRMAHEILERSEGAEELALVGIHTAGVPLAKRLQTLIEKAVGGQVEVPVGMIDITLYRDDAFIGLPHPMVGQTELPFRVTGRHVVLVDDVLYTGRTIRSAIGALIDFGRPKRIQLAVLVDRGHRELPIQADVVGHTVQTLDSESVKVSLTELGSDTDNIVLRERASE